MIPVAARASPLSCAQIQEVCPPHITFEPHLVQSTGDLDLKTSLRTLDKTDFFTDKVDALVLNGTCRLAVHSAKDLPAKIPSGLKIIAITRGIDPSDSLVLREFDQFETLKPGSLIATSSLRREETVKALRSDLNFRDLRGTIHKRLELLEKGEADGVVIAEAALIRLNLMHLNRIRLPGQTTSLQGQLAILAKEGDKEMEELFAPLDSRRMPRALYLGPEYPLKAFPNRHLTHIPLIETKIRSIPLTWDDYTHIIFTSKTAVRCLATLLRKQKISPFTLASKTTIAVGEATADLLRAFQAKPLVAEEENGEGVVALLEKIDLKQAHVFWPHSSLSRDLIEQFLRNQGIKHTSSILYDTYPTHHPLSSLDSFQEILFSSPSTVDAFFATASLLPPTIQLTPIGKVTAQHLSSVRNCGTSFGM